jgi:23S rRNA pseudouridine1911/1915/1917 synthase
VHPGAGHDATQTTLVEALLAHTSLCTQTQDKLRPGIVHRLDKDTTGVIICAKSIEAYESLSKQFLQKTNHREYLALLDGFMEKENLVHGSYLYRNPKNRLAFASCSKKQHETKSPTTSVKYRWAESSFHKVTTFGHRLTLASIRLHTGRTHQIRVHSKDLNLPVVGDPLYNRQHMLPQSFSKDITAQISSIGRQMLHAKSLGFEHPTTRKKLSFTAPLPEDFKNLLSSLKKYEN